MNSLFPTQTEYREQQHIQSFYEPSFHILLELYEQKKFSLRKKGYDENNAAVTKVELSQLMARRFRITIYYANQIITSLIKSNSIETFGGYVKPLKESNTNRDGN